MPKLPISLVIITKNEEANIAACIESAPFVSEVIVLDSGSLDQTVEKAKTLGAKVFEEPWKGFGLQKQSATDKANFDWVLALDADERVSPELAKELESVFNGPLTHDAYQIPRLSFHMGRWIRHGGWYPDYQTRFFNRKKCHWTPVELHEKIVSSHLGRVQNHLEHFVFRNLFHQVEANNKYSTLGASELFHKGQSFSLLRLLVKPWSKFIETYFWKLGLLDGVPGFVIAVGAAYSMFLRQSKLWELHNKKRISN